MSNGEDHANRARAADAESGLDEEPQLVARLDSTSGQLVQAPGIERAIGLPDDALSGADLLELVQPSSVPRLVSTLTVLLDQPGTTRSLLLELSGPGGHRTDIAVMARCDTTRAASPVVTLTRAHQEPAWVSPQRDLLGDRERLKSELAVAVVRDQVPTIVALKIDNLDTIEAAYGAWAFDQLIEQIRHRISTSVESVRAHALLGASTTAFLLVEPRSSARQPLATGQAIRDLVSLPFAVGGTELFLFPRLAVASASSEEPETALRATMLAVERMSGPTTVQVVGRVDRDDARRALQLRSELRYAIEREELRAVYQPYVDARTGLVAGAEALVRWEHPVLGRLGPSDFVPLAEDTDFIDAVGRWMLSSAARWTSRWLATAGAAPGFVISVNLSARQLVDPSVVEAVRDALSNAGLDPGALCCEITETALLADMPVVDEVLNDLLDAGVQIAIDDFGTGHATLDYLQRVPASTVKIDRQFIRPIPDDARAVELVRGIIELAHGLGKSVVAEGVESGDQAAVLRQLHCDFIQGHLVSRPLDEDDFTSLMAATSGVPLLHPPTEARPERRSDAASVVIVDAELAIVGAVRAALEASGLRVVGSATSISEAVEVVRRADPDVILSERQLPDGDVTEHLGRFAAAAPGAATLIFTSKPDERSLSETLASGGKGYLDKQSSFGELVGAIRQVAAGEVWIAPRLLPLLTRRRAETADASLTDRELDVLAMLARGSSTNEIAAELVLSVHTARDHIERVMRKLGARTRLEAVSIAAERAILSR